MSKGAALDKWIEDDMRDVPCAMPVDEAGEYMCRAAWHAGVKHTLEHIAGKIEQEGGSQRQQWLHELSAWVLRMKP